MFTRQNVQVVKREQRIYTSSSGSKSTITVKESVQTTKDGETTTKETISVSDLPEAFSKKLVTSASVTSNKSTPPSSNSSPSTPSPPLPSSSGRGSSTPQASPASSVSKRSVSSRPSIHESPDGIKFTEDSLKRHNEYRLTHGVPPMKLSPDLCHYAQEWATKLAQINILQHRSNHKYGENIFMTSKTEITGNDAVDSWYKEIKDHTFGQEPVSMNTGHFTQVIWRSSAELGIAKAKGKSGTYVVANYDPAGNMLGEYVKNVPAPL